MKNIETQNPVEPRCIHFGQCGGCKWQHVAYSEQLQFKQNHVETCLEGLGVVDSIIACEDPWHYRNKMEFSFSSDKYENRYLGLLMARGKVLQLTECHLPAKWYVDAINATKEWWIESGVRSYHFRRNTGSLRTLTLRDSQRTGDRLAMLTVSGNPDDALTRKQLDSFTSALQKSISPESPDSRLSIFLRIQQIKKGTPTEFFEMHLAGPDHIREILHVGDKTLTFHVSPTAFFQPNTRQAERLYQKAIELAKIPKGAVVYDLYCGTGTLGIAASTVAKEVIGVELSPESILDAKGNAKLNGCDNITFYCGDVQEVLKDEGLPKPDLIMVDPPRVGLSPLAITHLLALKPDTILYISCNPVTQAENVRDLVEGGYTVSAIQPVDQFPHTPHTENIVLLTCK